jgi:hypothetical protein
MFHGEPATIEHVADPDATPNDYYVHEFGGGVVVLEPKFFGRAFLRGTNINERLEFVSRRVDTRS